MSSETYPVGCHFAGYSVTHRRTQIYLCTFVEPGDVGLVNVDDATDKKLVSPRALGRNLMLSKRMDDGRWNAESWGVLDLTPKVGDAMPNPIEEAT